LPCADLDCPEAGMGAVLVMRTLETANSGTQWEFARRFVSDAGRTWFAWDAPIGTTYDAGKEREETHARSLKFITRGL